MNYRARFSQQTLKMVVSLDRLTTISAYFLLRQLDLRNAPRNHQSLAA